MAHFFYEVEILMRAIIITFGLLMLLQPGVAQKKVFATSSGYASFFSEAPIADVDARNKKVKVSLNPSSGQLTVDLNMKDFQFRNAKMGRDAQRKYIEIDKYPEAGFNGKLTGEIDYEKPGKYPATAKGKLKIHGVEKEVSEKGTVTVEKDKILLVCEFKVELKDYNIETPTILGKEMTQDNMLVKFGATLQRR
jgi:polyisoprenoid-binding protein YceI